MRVDGYSVFSKDQRNQVYVKGSGSYVLSESEFCNKLSIAKWWNLAKLRVAYGQSGNLTGIGPYARFNSYSSNAFIGRTALYSSSVLSNPEISPEGQKELEMGTDLSFLSNR